MTAKRDSHIVHVRIPFDALCGVIEFTKGKADTLSGSVALFLSSVVEGMRRQGVIPPSDTNPRSRLVRLLAQYELGILTNTFEESEEPNFRLTGNQPQEDEPTVSVREILRRQISEAEQLVTQPQAETKFYDFEHGPGYEDVERAAQQAVRPKPDLDAIPKLGWSQIEEWAPLDRFVVQANDRDDPVLFMTIRIVYKNLPLGSWGTSAAERLIQSTYPMVQYGMDMENEPLESYENLG